MTARPTLRDLFNFSGLVDRMKKNPELSRTEMMGVMIAEQSSETGAPKSLNKILARSVQATKDAAEANERAAQLRNEGAAIELEWERLCERYQQIAASIEVACAVRGELQAIVDGGFEEPLRASFNWGGDANKAKEIAIEISKAVGAVPVIAKMIAKMRGELLSHANTLGEFAREHDLPEEATKDLVNA
jgi:hypothetical protein